LVINLISQNHPSQKALFMISYIDPIVTELRALIADLGKGGGLISPSVYDTAQVLRFYPPNKDIEPAFQWLLAQQRADGGWGSAETPYARDVPTLAAVLALHTYYQGKQQEAVDAGLTFLQQQAEQWAILPIDALPIATEMILPYLIEEANSYGLAIDPTPYAVLYQLRNRKREKIGKRPLQAGAAPTYSWEALGQTVDTLLPDHSGGIGHSPAATAAWLRQATKQPELAEPCASACRYLTNAAAATGIGIPGVVPNVWPIVGFELAYAPYALLITGLLQHPALQDVIDPVMDELWVTMKRGHGVSFGEYFTPDVDVTGVSMAALLATSRPVDPALIFQFKSDNHFCTYPQELNPSVFSNAHALYALSLVDKRYGATEDFLKERQCEDGRWLPDKWHSSWLYTTLEVTLTLDALGYTNQVMRALKVFMRNQKSDGGWGSGCNATKVETSYAIIALQTAQKHGYLDAQGTYALESGFDWLARNFQSQTKGTEMLWLGKELYTPQRVDRIYELSALLSVALEPVMA